MNKKGFEKRFKFNEARSVFPKMFSRDKIPPMAENLFPIVDQRKALNFKGNVATKSSKILFRVSTSHDHVFSVTPAEQFKHQKHLDQGRHYLPLEMGLLALSQC